MVRGENTRLNKSQYDIDQQEKVAAYEISALCFLWSKYRVVVCTECCAKKEMNNEKFRFEWINYKKRRHWRHFMFPDPKLQINWELEDDYRPKLKYSFIHFRNSHCAKIMVVVNSSFLGVIMVITPLIIQVLLIHLYSLCCLNMLSVYSPIESADDDNFVIVQLTIADDIPRQTLIRS